VKRLWINADDLGLTPAVSAAICEAIEGGAVATTTAMVCGVEAAETIARCAPRIPGRIGLHLQLTDGAPRSCPGEVPSLVGPGGGFPRNLEAMGQLDPRDVAREWEAQLRALRELGIEPTHVDSHHHVHQLPGVFAVYVELARRHGLRARGGTPAQVRRLRERGVPTADVFSPGFYRGALDAADLLAVVAAAARRCPQGGTIELMSHPGRADDELRRRSIYVEERERELATLCSPELPERLRARGIALVGGGELLSAGGAEAGRRRITPRSG
jgi:predicted glycoside hydrolase/deacetylase ChbG (UPF0249 family)